MKFSLLIGYLGLVVGQTITPVMPELGTLAQFGALGVLFWVVKCQRGEIKEQRDSLDAIRKEHSSVVGLLCERWDGWEKQRHKDSEKLDTTLQNMIRHCSEHNTR